MKRLALAAALLASSPALAANDNADHTQSVTLSPVHLAAPMLEAAYEYSLGGPSAVQGIAGIGATSGVFLFTLGGQYRHYLLGNFSRGVGVGGEVTYTNGSLGGVSASALTAGPLATGKYAFGFGLTGVLDVGYQAVLASGATGGGLLLNLNLGWSF